MTFAAWLKKQARRHDPVGDLARDFRTDRKGSRTAGLPRVTTADGLRRRLDDAGACVGAYEALDRAEAEHRREHDQHEQEDIA